MRAGRIFAAIVAAQILFLAGWAGSHEWALRTGKTILLEVQRVDPRDILRGDYIILEYPVQRIPFGLFRPPLNSPPAVGAEIFVELDPAGDTFKVVGASLKSSGGRADGDGTHILLRGRVGERRWRGIETRTVWVDYGIGKFFVPEGKGTPRGKMVAVVAVGRGGRPTLKGLLVDGRPYP